MAKKPPKTFSLVQMAQSLEAQSSATLLLISRIETAQSLAEHADTTGLRKMLADIAADAAKVQGLLWPEQN